MPCTFDQMHPYLYGHHVCAHVPTILTNPEHSESASSMPSTIYGLELLARGKCTHVADSSYESIQVTSLILDSGG